MRRTLLQLVQSVLSAIDSDQVNSISDTTESLQVVEIIRNSYFTVMESRDWDHLKTKTTLTALGDTNNPTKMQVPTNIQKVYWIRYNNKPVTYIGPDEFAAMIETRISSGMDNITADGYLDNRDPEFWTSYDDTYIVFDAYDSDTEATLQSSNSTIYALRIPDFTADDDHYLDMPARFFQTILAEATATAFHELKQSPSPRQERKAQRGKVQLRHNQSTIKDKDVQYGTNINYGRK